MNTYPLVSRTYETDEKWAICSFYLALSVAEVMSPVRRILYTFNMEYTFRRTHITSFLLVAHILPAGHGDIKQFLATIVVES